MFMYASFLSSSFSAKAICEANLQVFDFRKRGFEVSCHPACRHFSGGVFPGFHPTRVVSHSSPLHPLGCLLVVFISSTVSFPPSLHGSYTDSMSVGFPYMGDGTGPSIHAYEIDVYLRARRSSKRARGKEGTEKQFHVRKAKKSDVHLDRDKVAEAWSAEVFHDRLRAARCAHTEMGLSLN